MKEGVKERILVAKAKQELWKEYLHRKILKSK